MTVKSLQARDVAATNSGDRPNRVELELTAAGKQINFENGWPVPLRTFKTPLRKARAGAPGDCQLKG